MTACVLRVQLQRGDWATSALCSSDHRPSHRPSAEQTRVRTPSSRRRKAPRSSEATSKGGVFSSRTQPSLQKLHDLNTEIDSYPKYALSRAKAHSLTDFKPFTQYAAPLCGRRSLDFGANAPAGKWSRPASKTTGDGDRSPGQLLDILLW